MIEKIEKYYICLSDTGHINVLMLVVLFLISGIVIIFIAKNINIIDTEVKKNQKGMIFFPIGVSVVLVFLYFVSNGTMDSNVLIALLTFITFCFTLLNVYISNYWSEISNHRNTTLVDPPHLQYRKDKCEKEIDGKKYAYSNEGGSAAKYVKLYEFGLETKENSDAKNGDKKPYETIKLVKVKYVHSKINKVLDRSVMPSKGWLPCEIAAELIGGKKENTTQCSNVIIHTDFSQRNIFITYTYFSINEEIAIPKVKRFTPLSYDFTYDCLINIEEMLEALKKFITKNYSAIEKVENDSEKKEFVELQTEFIKFVISDYLERMRN